MTHARASAAVDNTAPATAPAVVRGAMHPHPGTATVVAPSLAAQPLGAGTAAQRGATLDMMQHTQGNQAVLRMLDNPPHRSAMLHRKCGCGGGSGSGQGECAECKASLNRTAAADGAASSIPPIVHDVLRSSGQPMELGARTFMEPRFGQDFGAVRIHTGAIAAESAAAVNALAYTVGRHVVFGAGQYSPGTEGGRRLIAHELAHVAQNGGAEQTPPRAISGAGDASEREADSVAEAVMRTPAPSDLRVQSQSAPPDEDLLPKLKPKVTAASAVLHRQIVVDPAGETGFILGELNTLCPGKLAASGDTITQSCEATTNNSCDCACDAAGDPARTYTVHVQPAAGMSRPQTLWDGTTQAVPDSTLWPNTSDGNDPDIYVESAGSTIEFGFFKSDGTASWYPHWRILAHELCGHGRLHQTYSGGTGNRPGHDVTIDTENTIAAEHGQPARGHFADTRQGEAFYNGVGDRSKVVFYQTNGLHYEAP